MTVKVLGSLMAAGLTTLLFGCGYAVSVNERVVYTPASLFTDYKLADTLLHKCVEQSVIDQQVTQASGLKQLNCSNAGIQSLAGLEIFTGIEALNLTSNDLIDVKALASLSQLKIVLLSNNRLQSAAPLLSLLKLEQLDVSENPALTCNDLTQLQRNYAGQTLALKKPAQCS